MKRKRDAEEILISSDSEREEKTDTEWEEEGNDNDVDDGDEEEGSDDDDDDDDDDNDDEDEDEDEDDEDGDDDEDAYDDEDDDDDDDDDEEEEEEEDYGNDTALRCESERVPSRKAQKRVFSGCHGDRNVESRKKAKKKTRNKQRLKKGGGHTASAEDQKLFAEALNIIRQGDLEKLKLEHCKAYLRHYSLRLTGSKTILLDRVQEHVELKASCGMAKYPSSTFTINCTGDACTGDVVLFKQKVKNYKKSSRSSTKPSWGRRVVVGRIVKESYGSDKQQHTFTVEVLWSRGPKTLPLLYPLLIKGRNLYRLATFRQRWPNEEERKRVLQEKHSRGDVARNAREDRVSGKRHSCSNQTRLSNRKASVTSKREQRSVNFSKVNAGQTSSFRQKARSDSQSKETAFREGSLNSRVVSTNREYENRFCETLATTKCILSIKACFAGLLVGSKGRNIGAIARASGARLQICEDRLNPTSRLVEIIGVNEQVQVATGMVMKSFLDRGLPPPAVTMQPSGFTGQGWQGQNPPYNVLPVPNHNIFLPYDAMRRRFR